MKGALTVELSSQFVEEPATQNQRAVLELILDLQIGLVAQRLERLGSPRFQ